MKAEAEAVATPSLAKDRRVLTRFFSIQDPVVLRNFYLRQAKIGGSSVLFLPETRFSVVLHLRLNKVLGSFGIEGSGFPDYQANSDILRGFSEKGITFFVINKEH